MFLKKEIGDTTIGKFMIYLRALEKSWSQSHILD